MQAECAICFDSIGEDAIPLPCSCRVPYCLACWDRSLAVSFNDTGHARCPTCRTPVRVDFDPEAAGGRGRLVFTREDGDQGDIDRSRSGVVNRLAEQAAPLMTRNLRSYGEAHPTLRAMAQDPATALASRPVRELKALLETLGGDPSTCFEKVDLLDRLQETAGGAGQLAAYCTAQEAAPPKQDDPGSPSQAAPASSSLEAPVARLRCVCGGTLERVSGIERARSLYAKDFPQLSSDQLRQLLQLQGEPVAAAASRQPCPEPSTLPRSFVCLLLAPALSKLRSAPAFSTCPHCVCSRAAWLLLQRHASCATSATSTCRIRSPSTRATMASAPFSTRRHTTSARRASCDMLSTVSVTRASLKSAAKATGRTSCSKMPENYHSRALPCATEASGR